MDTMKQRLKQLSFSLGAIMLSNFCMAQCSICTKTAQQLGQGPASALNAGIVYLMIAPLAIIGFVGYKWYKKEKEVNANL
ncbi:MAG: hypothetical protein ACOVNR_02655 [Chitinophagaceae bacterium]